MKREQAEAIAMASLERRHGLIPSLGPSPWVIDAIIEAVAIEREECAKVCDSVDNYANPMTAKDCADTIRARGER